MKRFQTSLLIMVPVLLSPAIACANAGPTIFLQFGFHLVFLTWIIGLGEGLLLCTFFRAWKVPSWRDRVFISMIAANVASAWLGMLFVKSRYAAQITGDVTIENLIPAFWTMVYVTFLLTMIIEFPFFLVALYGRKWLVPKTVTATLIVHCISYSLLFFFYSGEESMSMVTKLEVVPVSTFEMEEDYDLYYISPDGRHVLRSDLRGNEKEIITTLDMNGIPLRLTACPRKTAEEMLGRRKVQRVCWDSGFDLFVLMNINGAYKATLLMENFAPQSAVYLTNDGYTAQCNPDTRIEPFPFRIFDDDKRWKFLSRDIFELMVGKAKQGYYPYTTREYEKDSHQQYTMATPFTRWLVQNGTHIAGDYGVFLLGKDQICILDPEKKRIALIARGFGPVVAKPPLEEIPEKTPEETNEQTVNEVP